MTRGNNLRRKSERMEHRHIPSYSAIKVQRGRVSILSCVLDTRFIGQVMSSLTSKKSGRNITGIFSSTSDIENVRNGPSYGRLLSCEAYQCLS